MFKAVDELKSPNLMKYCISKPEMREYIPNKSHLDTIERNFWIKVIIIIFIIILNI
jgi:hypothetical protein